MSDRTVLISGVGKTLAVFLDTLLVALVFVPSFEPAVLFARYIPPQESVRFMQSHYQTISAFRFYITLSLGRRNTEDS